MPRNRQDRNDRIERGVDNPRVQPEAPRMSGRDFQDFPRLVVQLGRPRPQARGGGARPGEAPAGTDPSGPDPKEGFARPLRGMGVNRYEGLRDQMAPQMQSYRASLHDAYKDDTISDEERKSLRGQRRDLRTDVRQHRNQHPLQMGLGSRVSQMDERTGGIGEAVKGLAHSPDVGQKVEPSLDQLRELQEAWKSGKMSPEQILAALGFTGRLPNG